MQPLLNPIKQLKLKEGITYEKMAEKSGLSINTIYEAAKARPEDVLKMSVDTCIKIKKALGINLLVHYWKNK